MMSSKRPVIEFFPINELKGHLTNNLLGSLTSAENRERIDKGWDRKRIANG